LKTEAVVCTFYSMRILLTGASGFIGSHFIDNLQKHEVVAVTRAPLTRSAAHVTNVVAEHSDTSALRDALKGCQSVIHLAAQSSPQRAAEDPAECIESNVTFTARLAHLAYLEQVPHFVLASSALVYGSPEKLPITELTPIAPAGVYGASKIAAEVVLRQIHPNVAVLRIFNVFGPRQTGTLIPALIEKIAAGEQPTLQGDGSQIRSFLFVKDCVDALLRTVETGYTGTLNIAGHKASIIEVFQYVADALGVSIEPAFGPGRQNDAAANWASHLGAFTALGWAPNTTLSKGIAITAQGFRDNLN
jgi:UDP-glucose 4-epimerase